MRYVSVVQHERFRAFQIALAIVTITMVTVAPSKGYRCYNSDTGESEECIRPGGSDRTRGSHWCSVAEDWCEPNEWCTKNGCSATPPAQEDEGPVPGNDQAKNLTLRGNQAASEANYSLAEAYYREAWKSVSDVDLRKRIYGDWSEATAESRAKNRKFTEAVHWMKEALQSGYDHSVNDLALQFMYGIVQHRYNVYEARRDRLRELRFQCEMDAPNRAKETLNSCPLVMSCLLGNTPSIGLDAALCTGYVIKTEPYGAALSCTALSVDVLNRVQICLNEGGSACKVRARNVVETQLAECRKE